MIVFHDITDVEKKINTVLTIGTFDGFHLGHQKIMEQVITDAKLYGGRSMVITFEPHPRSVVSKNYDLKLLTSKNEKTELFSKAGIDCTLVINFTMEFSNLSAEEFIKEYIIKRIGVRELVIGHDHHFGKDRVGDENKLKELGKIFAYDVRSVNSVRIKDEIINSTKIRNALLEGKVEKANDFLGRYYSISGKVIEGAKRGRTLGFPTANIDLDNKQKLIPANGIYIVEFYVSSIRHFGLMNIGTRPTFNDSNKVVVEVYLYDFNGDIYGETVTINMVHRLRDEIKYPSKEELIKQMEIDKIDGTKIIKNLIN